MSAVLSPLQRLLCVLLSVFDYGGYVFALVLCLGSLPVMAALYELKEFWDRGEHLHFCVYLLLLY